MRTIKWFNSGLCYVLINLTMSMVNNFIFPGFVIIVASATLRTLKMVKINNVNILGTEEALVHTLPSLESAWHLCICYSSPPFVHPTQSGSGKAPSTSRHILYMNHNALDHCKGQPPLTSLSLYKISKSWQNDLPMVYSYQILWNAHFGRPGNLVH